MRLTLVLVLVALFAPSLAPLAWAHSEDEAAPPSVAPAAAGDETSAPSAGYSGPGAAPYVNFYEGVWFYGSVSVANLPGQYPVNIRGDGDWLVWEDAIRGDIFAYNIPAGAGQYLTTDRALQRNPAISNDIVVWEDYRNSTHADVYAYWLQTGEVRRISAGPGNHHNPTIQGSLIVWEDDRDRTGDLWAYNLETGAQYPLVVSPDRESDAVIVGNQVYYRTYRFNVWDVHAINLDTNTTEEITSDLAINGAPFSNDEDVFYLSQFFSAWKLNKYSPSLGESVDTTFRFQDTTGLSVTGDHLLSAVRDRIFRQLVAMNLSSGESTHVSGSVSVTTEPWLDNRTAYLTAVTHNGVALLTFQISPFAFTTAPVLHLSSPRSGAPWLQAMLVEGILKSDRAWEEPATFSYRINGGPPTAIAYAERWRFTLEPEGVAAGSHQITIRATYREGPPVQQTLLLFIPQAGSSVDIAQAAEAFHAARVVRTMNLWILENPASYAIALAVVLLIVVLFVRFYVYVKPRRQQRLVEYVPPADDS